MNDRSVMGSGTFSHYSLIFTDVSGTKQPGPRPRHRVAFPVGAGRVVLAGWLTVLALFASAAGARAQDPRQIVDEAQRRTRSISERYEGVLQVVNDKGKVADKSWAFARMGSHGNSKSVLRFTAPAEVKGVALLVVNHPDRASDQWMWTPAIQRDRSLLLECTGQPLGIVFEHKQHAFTPAVHR